MSWRQLGQFVFVSRSLAMGRTPNQAPDKMVNGYGRSMYRIQYHRISGKMVTGAVCVDIIPLLNQKDVYWSIVDRIRYHHTNYEMVTGAVCIEYNIIIRVTRWLLEHRG
jgi:hypothetical protein